MKGFGWERGRRDLHRGKRDWKKVGFKRQISWAATFGSACERGLRKVQDQSLDCRSLSWKPHIEDTPTPPSLAHNNLAAMFKLARSRQQIASAITAPKVKAIASYIQAALTGPQLQRLSPIAQRRNLSIHEYKSADLLRQVGTPALCAREAAGT